MAYVLRGRERNRGQLSLNAHDCMLSSRDRGGRIHSPPRRHMNDRFGDALSTKFCFMEDWGGGGLH